jgi:PKD repeat protein
MIRVWYAFSLSGSVVPGDADWISAESLNAIDDTLWDSADLHKGLQWKLWNKIEVKGSYSPCHDYSDSARVYLRTYGTCDESYPFSVRVQYYPLNADFVGSPDSGSSPLQVDFIDLSTCNPTSWYWDFGDNSTSSQQNPTHVYNDTGFFDVRLIASTVMHGEYSDVDTIVKADYIHVSGLPLIANFSAAPEVGSAPLEVQFTDQSAGNPTHWHWDFGDGYTDSVQNPPHTYYDTGYFDVSLIVSNGADSNRIVKEDYIHLLPLDSIPFAPAANYGTGTEPFSVFCADLDGDGDLDLAVANFGSNNVSILKNNGWDFSDCGQLWHWRRSSFCFLCGFRWGC